MKLNWTITASEDMEQIFKFYSIESEYSATEIYNEILDYANHLSAFPKIGFIEPLLVGKRVQFRSLVIKKIFKLIYYIQEDTINITHVWDCRQNPERLIKNIR